MTKYIFVVGGVISGVGKGIASASIGKILQSRGFKVSNIKIDPYVNVDAGTMNPTEHGEIFILDDGKETDQDMGIYERFLGESLPSLNYMTTGSIYQNVINKERNLGYGGKCVEVVPHIPLEIIEQINKAKAKSKADFVIIEIGGTIGEYQNILFLEAARMLKLKKPNDVLFVLISYLPIPGKIGEMKTKPTQYAVRTLNSSGIQPDIIIARARVPLDKKRKEKIAFNCNIGEEDVISAPDIKNIYEVPINFEKDHLSNIVLKKLKLKPRLRKKNLKEWARMVRVMKTAKQSLKIGIVGKYFSTGNFILCDSYISVIEAIKHAAYFYKKRPLIDWIDAENFGSLKKYDGIIVPGGFGGRGAEGKIKAIQFCRQNKIPLLGLCYGMQLMIIEFSRNVCGLRNANSTEVNRETKYPVIDIMPEQKKNIEDKNYGATMRLGAFPAALKKGTIAFNAYKEQIISERHRHRWEVNPDYVERLEKKGLIFSGTSPDKRLMEIIELSKNKHQFFLGTQFHPEFKSRFLQPHPLFREFIRAMIKSR
jgi:CTP synthase